jgi:hypothetical protein
MAHRIEYEDQFSLSHLEIENYNKLKASLIPLDEKNIQEPYLDVAFPDVKPSLHDVLAKMPFNVGYRLYDARIVVAQDSTDITKFSTFRNTEFDLPRGISPEQIISFSDGFAEIEYHDELIGSSFIVHGMKLKQTKLPQENICDYIAEQIIKTRNYSVEEKETVTVDAGEKLSGNLVNIEPRSGVLARYLILADPKKEFLFFVQSNRATRDQILVFARSIAQADGLMTYPDFYNTFAVLPEKADQRQPLFFYRLERLRNQRGASGPLLEHNLRAELLFYDQDNGVWGVNLTSFYQPETAVQIYERQYAAKKPGQGDTITVQNEKGWASFARRQAKGGKQSQRIAEEIHWKSGNYIVSISNRGVAYLSKEEMMDFAELLRLNVPRTERKNWLSF